MCRKNLQAVMIASLLTLPAFTGAAFALPPSPPPIFTTFSPTSLPVAVGCPAVFTIHLEAPVEFQGEANLTVTNLPRGMNATFYPNPVKFPYGYNPAKYPSGFDAFAYLMVTVTPDTPLGKVTIITNGTILPHNEMERYYYVTVTELTLNVVPTGPCTGPEGPQISNSTTTTSTTSNAIGNPRIVTMITTTTVTTVSTELLTVTSISVSTTTTLPPTTQTYTVSTITLLPNTADSWSAYALAASIVIAAVVITVVLLPRRNR